ncbi:MAG TPA: aldo/keto reductase [Beijerinckiaceae bacterium]|jgi:diketogulonate reductase-like aldo/keto reductase|nr:aldo/keto reductase [Beijerinckiaceae bacterium]
MTMHNVQAGGASIPSLGFGTWAARGDECAQAVTWALESGYRHVDTAAVYANEEAVGDGIRASRVPRGEIFLTTKVGPDDIDEGKLERSAEASLKRLGFDHVDLLLIHWPSPKIPLKRSMAALAKAKRRGLTRHIGVSNFTPALIAEALALSEEPIVTNQCEYHPRLDQSRLIAACRQKEVSFTSYCPLGRAGDILTAPKVTAIAKRHGKTPAQVLLRWQVQQQGVIAIPKSANRQRIAENIAIFDFALDDAEMGVLFGLAIPQGRIVSPAWAPDWKH